MDCSYYLIASPKIININIGGYRLNTIEQYNIQLFQAINSLAGKNISLDTFLLSLQNICRTSLFCC